MTERQLSIALQLEVQASDKRLSYTKAIAEAAHTLPKVGRVLAGRSSHLLISQNSHIVVLAIDTV